MSKNKLPDQKNAYSEFSRQIGLKEARKLRAQRTSIKTIWYGLGMIGLIGWSVVLPTVSGVFLGIWMDKNVPINGSWTLILLFAGLFLGCSNAWRWIKKEEKKIKDEQEKTDE